ncbi:MAG: matrixin family metalloprotease [Candidatus Doudnabacteria bacterium]|nr:matrixin family metalloprotease [Candidatus Doudnabacteria bacterium]
MRKLITALLLVFVLLISSFVILKILAAGSEDNFFNQKYRPQLGRSQLLRQILQLHDYGDQRYEYLGSKNSTIDIEIDSMDGLVISDKALNLLVEKIAAVTGKKVIYYFSDHNILFTESVEPDYIDTLVKIYRDDSKPAPGVAKLYILYLSQSADHPTELGITHGEYGIILFDTGIKNLTQSNPMTFDSYVESTALHEFGHQLGLGHNERANCLMNAKVESDGNIYYNSTDVITDFCDYEKALIRANY